MSTDLNEEFKREVEKMLAELEHARMPFGKYGPGTFHRQGVPLHDLPYEYLAWFKRQGFPKGKLGRMMAFVHQMKLEGADCVFDPLRDKKGGRTNLRESPRHEQKI